MNDSRVPMDHSGELVFEFAGGEYTLRFFESDDENEKVVQFWRDGELVHDSEWSCRDAGADYGSPDVVDIEDDGPLAPQEAESVLRAMCRAGIGDAWSSRCAP